MSFVVGHTQRYLPAEHPLRRLLAMCEVSEHYDGLPPLCCQPFQICLQPHPFLPPIPLLGLVRALLPAPAASCDPFTLAATRPGSPSHPISCRLSSASPFALNSSQVGVLAVAELALMSLVQLHGIVHRVTNYSW